MRRKYPKWIDEYAKSFHNASSNMTPTSWGPLDALSLVATLDGVFLSKVYEAIGKVKAEGHPLEKIAQSFSSPSSLRAALFWLGWEYKNSKRKNKERFRELVDFLINVLGYMAKRDTFALSSNIVHSKKEVDVILNGVRWAVADEKIAREIGKLYNSLASLVFALYGDFFPQDSHEIYGPYDASRKFGPKSVLLIKHFPKIKPKGLWPMTAGFKHSEVKIYQVYRKVSFKCEFIGMHSMYKGNLIKNLVAYAVNVDGYYQNNKQKIKDLGDYFADKAVKFSSVYSNMSKQELKKKTLDWLCWQFVIFFKLAGMDWQPTKEMRNAVKQISVSNRFEVDAAPSFKEYTTSPQFEVYWLKELYK